MAEGQVPHQWREALGSVMTDPALRALGGFLVAEEAAGKTIYPPRGSRLQALELTAPDAVRVVILGQDPYHGPGQAHGLAFSVPEGVKPPPSLVNIFKEVESDCGVARPASGNLERWARQGVLLLNNALTVEDGKAGSHAGRGWELLTDAIVRTVAASSKPTVFMLWGSHAKGKAAQIAELGAGSPHLVLKAPHPSPLSAHRGFLGCGHFSAANQFLENHGRGRIEW